MKHIATWIDEPAAPYIEKVFRSYPDVLLWDARVGMSAPQLDGLLLTGGHDIAAETLVQAVPDPSLIVHPDPARDAWEIYIIHRALKQRAPLFAICRGLQILNVGLGGTLHLDIPGHRDFKFKNVQPLAYRNDATVRIPHVNSSHHQALDRLGRGLVVEATHAEDGTIEQARLADYPFGLAVQYHPERDEIYRPLFDAFVRAVRCT